jgi:hypothetical protein
MMQGRCAAGDGELEMQYMCKILGCNGWNVNASGRPRFAGSTLGFSDSVITEL